jgi:hypothetical protein
LSVAHADSWIAHSYGNVHTDSYGNGYVYSYSHCYRYVYAHGDCNSYCNGNCNSVEAHTDAPAASDASAASISSSGLVRFGELASKPREFPDGHAVGARATGSCRLV